ncbi:hypothetical protein JAAARDRAFT_38617 [Jaapia argillacea MUCL 33604]|uniref:DUF4470 domain-containing protein n=1 Tax=Jaapia argillacea MUCL 33604 TaxID=933084 RepID=A0A067PGW8_9AGAM|nr:hypothetical protein JAAARDRAFT_38617 [Jaapia argillacea MUCL 33604]
MPSRFLVLRWGNMPALDAINLHQNESDLSKDLSLAFVASGDLRNALRTINTLPEDYSGQLTFLMNDRDPHVMLRNLVLLLVLGTTASETVAAEVALHTWYSVSVPTENSFYTSATMSPFLSDMRQDGIFSVPLGPNSTLSGKMEPAMVFLLSGMSNSSYTATNAQDEYQRIRFASSSRDRLHRLYSGLESSHRLAFQEYHRSGLVLPFGAFNAHFNTPNRLLFSSEGRRLQNEHVDPLDSWDIREVMKAGRIHGAHPSDVYGCLYFYLSDQLRKFARRLRQFRVSFLLFNRDARELSRQVGANVLSKLNIPRSFDRIDVSNILDTEYVGISGVLSSWGPLLKDTKHATMLGYFMNWITSQPGARPESPTLVHALTRRLIREGKIRIIGGPDSDASASVASQMSYIDTIYDNSEAFSKFLASQDISSALKKSGMKLKEKHTIVPHRLCAPLEGRPNSLPVFPDKESWYFHVQMSSFTWMERFVEFARA